MNRAKLNTGMVPKLLSDEYSNHSYHNVEVIHRRVDDPVMICKLDDLLTIQNDSATCLDRIERTFKDHMVRQAVLVKAIDKSMDELRSALPGMLGDDANKVRKK